MNCESKGFLLTSSNLKDFAIRFWIILCLSLWTWKAEAQQVSQNSLYAIDPYQFNPAFGGFDKSLSINANYRSQWTGIESNPAQFYINAHLPVYLWKGGAGLSLRRDRAGAISYTEISASYNRVQAMGAGFLSLGVRLGLRQLALDNQAIRTPEGIYTGGQFSHEDLLLLENLGSVTSPTWTIGGIFQTRQFIAGLTLSDYLFSPVGIDGASVSNHNYLSLYFSSDIYLESIKVSPSVLIKSNNQAVQVDIGGIVKSGNIFGGISLRGFNQNTFDSIIFLGGIRLNAHYTLSYSYDVGINALRSVSQGSHEIHINYNLNKLIGIGLDPAIIYNPRNL